MAMGGDADGPADLDMLWEVVREGDRASIEALLIGVCASRRVACRLFFPLFFRAARTHAQPSRPTAARVQDDDHPPLGVSIDVRDDKGMTPLHWLSVEGHSSVVQWLVDEVGAELDLGDARYGQSALHFAASKNQAAVAQQLIELGSDALKTDAAGWTPLHAAARAGSVEVSRALIEALPAGGADALGPDGQTALHRAAFWGHTELVTVLLEGGGTSYRPPPLMSPFAASLPRHTNTNTHTHTRTRHSALSRACTLG